MSRPCLRCAARVCYGVETACAVPVPVLLLSGAFLHSADRVCFWARSVSACVCGSASCV